MTINRKWIAIVVFVLAICGASVSSALGQQASASSTGPARVIKYDGDMGSMLAQLVEIYGVTIGLEVDAKQPKPQVGFYLQDPTLSDVLNAMTRSATRYQWRVSEGQVEFFPLEGSSPLLGTMIGNFQVDNVDEAEAINQLLNLPEVQANLKSMSLNRRDLGGTSTESNGKKFSIRLTGVTMRQALHKIAKMSGDLFWSFQQDSKGFFSITNSPG